MYKEYFFFFIERSAYEYKKKKKITLKFDTKMSVKKCCVWFFFRWFLIDAKRQVLYIFLLN